MVVDYWQPANAPSWSGFSFNPGLRRMSDYHRMKPMQQYGSEVGASKAHNAAGYEYSVLIKPYCTHIGDGRSKMGH